MSSESTGPSVTGWTQVTPCDKPSGHWKATYYYTNTYTRMLLECGRKSQRTVSSIRIDSVLWEIQTLIFCPFLLHSKHPSTQHICHLHQEPGWDPPEPSPLPLPVSLPWRPLGAPTLRGFGLRVFWGQVPYSAHLWAVSGRHRIHSLILQMPVYNHTVQ